MKPPRESADIMHENVIDNIKCSHIGESHVHGFGLFAASDIAAGTELGVLDGQIMLWDLFDQIMRTAVLPEEVYAEWNALSENTLLVRPFRTKYSFINHSRQPNLVIEYDPIRVLALIEIPAGGELFLDYRREPLRKEYIESHGKTYL